MKQLESNPFYVAPESLAIGARFEMRRLPKQHTAIPTQLQCRFAYVSILKTLKSTFQNEHFLQTYLDYNQFGGNGHKCASDEYVDFCCGSVHKGSSLFRNHPNSLQIQIYQDDFEVCVPIGSKATIHKICGVYFTIRNWPNNSRLRHIYLIALCNTDDLKTEQTDFNNIWKRVIEDIKVLENRGLDITANLNLRGAITNICADNAGANTCLGFAESFSASYFCRICELPKASCQSCCVEQKDDLRTVQKYDECIKTLENLTKADYFQTKGIRMKCSLNELNYFHAVENYCIDIMHDLAEGVIPFLLRHTFNFCIEKRILSARKLAAIIQYYNYGILNKQNVPSVLMIEKHNLNQNAAQSLCLFRHVPFIFYEYKEKLNQIWNSMTSLQRIVQIAHSQKILEEDLVVLSRTVQDHLESVMRNFSARLLPKHHNLTHYPTVIRSIGPLTKHSTIRFEAKHQEFKQFSKNNKNFKDLTYTLAVKHQKKSTFAIENFHNIRKISSSGNVFFDDMLNISHTEELFYEKSFILIDDRKFEKYLFVLHEMYIYEILAVLEANSSGFFLLCKRYDFVRYDSFLHSFEIRGCEPEIRCLLDYKTFENYELFEKKYVDGSIYVHAKNLDIQHSFQKSIS